MDLQLTEEQRMIRDMAREFAQREIAPIVSKYDESGEFPVDTIKKMGELGLMGIEVPPEYGGAGADSISYVVAVEEIAKVCAAHAVIMSVNNSLVCYGLQRFGTEDQKQKFLISLASGKTLGSYALTEPHAGSDASNLKTTAVRDGDHYVINGKKSWITGAPEADYIILFASTDKTKGKKGVSAFIIEKGIPGLIVGKVEPKLGIRASHSAEMTFEDYRIPVTNRLGEEGQGYKIALAILDAGRIGIAAQSLGIAEAAYEASAKYALEREAFGRKIFDFQAVQFTLADMATRIEASRLLIYKAALKKETGERFSREASMAKLFASETAMWATTKAIQIHGAIGYSKEAPLERYFRDAKVTEIYEGTSEIQRLVIGRWVRKDFGEG